MFQSIANFINGIPAEIKGVAIGFGAGLVINKVSSLVYKFFDPVAFAEKLYLVGKGIGVSISQFLRTKLGKKAENAIELLLIDIKMGIDSFLEGIMVGLRKDNTEKDEAKDISKIDHETNKISRDRIKELKERIHGTNSKTKETNKEEEEEVPTYDNQTKQRIEDLKKRLGVNR